MQGAAETAEAEAAEAAAEEASAAVQTEEAVEARAGRVGMEAASLEAVHFPQGVRLTVSGSLDSSNAGTVVATTPGVTMPDVPPGRHVQEWEAALTWSAAATGPGLHGLQGFSPPAAMLEIRAAATGHTDNKQHHA